MTPMGFRNLNVFQRGLQSEKRCNKNVLLDKPARMYMSQGIPGIRHFWKCRGNWGIPSIAYAIVGIPGISGNA